ncbi:MAG: ComEC family competence protein [Flammeovirgaceae bacterium]|nr:ComEC family competence protein [Flammeovirgaceae bacterium]
MRWIPYAMIRIAGFFIGGILLGIYVPNLLSISFLLYAVGASVLLYVAFYFLFRRSRWLGVLSGITGLLAIFLCGYLHTYFYTDTTRDSHLIHYNENYTFYTAKVLGAPEEKNKSWKLEVSLINVGDEGELHPVSGKVLLYISKDGFQHFKRGDILYIRGKPSLLKGPVNPNEFDFKRFLSFKNIFHQQFVTTDKVIKVGESRPDLIAYSEEIRVKAAAVLRRYVDGKDEQAVALALVLGVRDALDNDLQQAYASSGAMHVLAVSGLHVGIVYLIILLAFKPLKKYAWSRWVIAIISILILWSYAFVTGLSPSVLRAVTMFSFLHWQNRLGIAPIFITH